MSELTTLFQNTADAIRSKTGDTAAMKASQFPAKIQGISVGISQDEADARYLQLAGGTMTGALTLSGAPTGDLQAATKKYVDDHAGGIKSALIGTANSGDTNITFDASQYYKTAISLTLEYTGPVTEYKGIYLGDKMNAWGYMNPEDGVVTYRFTKEIRWLGRFSTTVTALYFQIYPYNKNQNVKATSSATVGIPDITGGTLKLFVNYT